MSICDGEMSVEQVQTSKSIKSEIGFLTPKDGLEFVLIKQRFMKLWMYHFFKLEFYIWIETNVFTNFINRIINNLTLYSLG